ncbi:cytochrome C5 [Microbacterium sp. NPDC091313]
MASDFVSQLQSRLADDGPLADPRVEEDVVHGRAWLEGLDAEVEVTVDPELEDGEEPDLDEFVAAVSHVLGLSGSRWVDIVDEVATEIEEAVESDGPIAETTDLRTELTLTSLTIFAEASLLRFVAPKQFPDSDVLVQLDEDQEINDLSVVERD